MFCHIKISLHIILLNFISAISTQSEPKNYKEAIKDQQWIQAMDTELDALKQNPTWIITYLPPGKKPIRYKWVYKIKHKADGSVERFKARLVAKEFTQVEGIDFF